MENENYLWPSARSCGNGNATLKINECCLDIFSNITPSSRFYIKNSACFKCNFTLQKPILQPYHITSFILNTDYPVEFYIENDKNKLCDNVYSFGNQGKYIWNISHGICDDIQIKEEPESELLNLGVIISIFISIFVAYGLYKCVLSARCFHLSRTQISFQELEADLGNPDTRDQNQLHTRIGLRRNSRVATVDVFRGIAITIMIFVNYGGGGYSVFKHSPWNGLTIADLVFPWFIWLMGLSIALSLRSKLRTLTSRKKIICHIVTRSLILILIGLILNSGAKTNIRRLDSFSSIRIPGVLQRIGLTYFVVALVEIAFIKPQRNERFGPWNLCADIVDSAVQWIFALLCVTVHVIITFLLPVPGCPTGYLGPGGWSEYSKYENCTGGAAGYIDRLLLTGNHLYQHPTCQPIYHTRIPYDPEGMLGTLTSIFCAFMGVHAGRIILSFERTSARIKRWLFWGLLLGVIAGYLSNFQRNGGYIPINKNLWSVSYVCLTTSFAFFIFSGLYFLIDHRRINCGLPFSYAGMNALVLYIGHELLKKHLPWYWKPFTDTHIELLFANITATVIWLCIAYGLYRRGVFISL